MLIDTSIPSKPVLATIFSHLWEKPETLKFNYLLPTWKSLIFFFQSFKILRQTLRYPEARHSWCMHIQKVLRDWRQQALE